MYSLLFQGEKSIVFVLAFVLALLLTYLAYRRTNPATQLWRRIVMAVLRLLAFFLLFFILMEPLVVQKGTVSVEPEVAVLIDNTLSVGLSDGEQVRSLSERAVGALSERYRTTAFLFSDSLDEGGEPSLDAQSTAIGSSMMYLRDLYADRNLGAVVLISDGQNNLGVDPLSVATHLPFPVLTAGVGRKEAPKNIAVRRIVANETGYVGVPTKVIAYIEGWGVEEVATVKLSHKGKLIDEAMITPGTRGQQQDVSFDFVPDTSGQNYFTISVSNVEGENIIEDNSRSFSMRILPSRKKILLAWDDLGWDVTFMKRALSSNEHYEIASVDFSGKIRGETPVPAGITDLSEYDVIYLIDFPITRELGRLFSEYLTRGGSLYHVLGPSSSFDRDFIGSSPFVAQPPRWATDEFQPRETIRGKGHPVMDMEGLEVPDNWTSELPPLTGFLIGDKLKRGVDMILEHPKLPGLPVLALYQSDKSRQVLLNGGDFWRWGFTPYGFGSDDRIWKRLVLNSTEWILSREEITPFAFTTDKRVYKSGEPVYFNAALRNESGEPVDGRVITLTVASDSGEVKGIMQENGGGFYSLDLGAMDVGEYTAIAEVDDDSGLPISKKATSFAVEAYSAEYADLRENVQLLQTISALTGGEYMDRAGMASTLGSLELPTVEKKLRNEWDLRYRWWLLVPILLFLAAEWIIRKRSNLP